MNVNLIPTSKVFLPSGVAATLNCIVHGVDFKHDVTVKDEMPRACFDDYPALLSAASINQMAIRPLFSPVTCTRNADRQRGTIALAWGM